MKRIIVLLLAAAASAHAQNVRVTNPDSQPVPVNVVAGAASGGGDASAANQTAVQANAGSDASKAVSVQGITGGKSLPVTSSNLPTTVDTNSGSKSASTLRIVLATDQPALTNKLLVTPDSVALPANQSVNVSQINGVTPLMGAGNTGTGSARVTIASDQAVILTKTIVATIATGQVTASGSPATLVAANTGRYKLTVRNQDTSLSVYVGPATVSSSNGALLKAGESRVFAGGTLLQVIAPSGSPVVDYVDETY